MKEKVYKVILLFSTVFLIVLMIRYPHNVSEGAKQGIIICVDNLISSMFPFLIVSSFILKSGTIEFIGKIFEKFSRKLFKVSGKTFSIFLLSLISGFPVGAKLAKESFEMKTITRSQASRLLCSSVNAGPAFVISVVGVSMMKSKNAGIVLLLSLSLSAFFMFILSGFIYKYEENDCVVLRKNQSLSSAFVESVYDSSKSIISICSFVVAFSCLCFNLKGGWKLLSLILEVSLGCKAVTVTYNLPLIAAVIGFGGICVHMQIFDCVLKIKMKKLIFFFFRILNSVVSFLICKALLLIFPVSISSGTVFAKNVSANISTNITACVGLLLMCAILIVDFEESRKIKVKICSK